jgi:hypothetical protein
LISPPRRSIWLAAVNARGYLGHALADFQANPVAKALTGAPRLAHILERTELFVDAAVRRFPSIALFVELPTGRPNPPLTMACGAVLIGLQHRLVDAFTSRCRFTSSARRPGRRRSSATAWPRRN